MSRDITVIVYRPGAEPVEEAHTDALENWQGIVGGYIEAVGLGAGLWLICNEDGRRMQLPPNRFVRGLDMIVGNFFVCRQRGHDFASVRPGDLTRLRAFIV